VEVGRVLGAWGIKGGIKVKPFAADPQALFSSKQLVHPAARNTAPAWRTCPQCAAAHAAERCGAGA
jgi:16S rRNA processing protein RimM